MGSMKVTIPDRAKQRQMWGSPGLNHVPMQTLEVSDKCPRCGGPRGEPFDYRFCEDGDWYTVSKWANPCGHIDHYSDVIQQEGAA